MIVIIATIAYVATRKITDSSLSFVMAFSFVLLCFIPQFSLYAGSMGKDSIFALFTIIYCIVVYDFFDNTFVFNWKCVLFFVASACLPLTRNGAIAIVLLTSMMLAICVEKKVLKYVALLSCLIALASSVFLPKVLEKETPKSEEKLSIPIQQIGYCVTKGYFSAEEMEAVSQLFSGADVGELYCPNQADPLKMEFHYDSLTDEQKATFWKLWMKCVLSHPKSAMISFLNMNNVYFSPGLFSNETQHVTSQRISRIEKGTVKPFFYEMVYILNSYDGFFCNATILGFFSRIGTYTWAMLYSIFSLLRRKDKRVIAYVPLICVFVGCCFSPVNGYFRYAFPFIFGTVILNMCSYEDWMHGQAKQ